MNTDNLSSEAPEKSSKNLKQGRLISKVLSPAVGLWLRSQVQQVSHLEVKIVGGDRQILTGYIPCVSVLAHHAVYQGLHLSKIDLEGKNIRTNLGQVLKGQPLQLLETVTVSAQLLLQESDLNASVQSPLLSGALNELLLMLLPDSDQIYEQVNWNKIIIDSSYLTINATLANKNNQTDVTLRTGLRLASSHELYLEQPQIKTQDGSLLTSLNCLPIDLGPEVVIEGLRLDSGLLKCGGRINVFPAD